MSNKGRDYLFYLEDMRESMHRILEYTDGLSYEEFKASNLKTDAVIRNLEIIGEASKNVPDRIKQKYPEIPWKQMYGLRNFVVHEYFGIDHENIWKIISDNLPKNIQDLEAIIEKENKESP